MSPSSLGPSSPEVSEAAASGSPPERGSRGRSIAFGQEAGLAVGIIVILGVIAAFDMAIIGRWSFFSWYSQEAMLHQIALHGSLALGAAVVIMAGGIDLSVGAIVALTSVLAAKIMVHWLPGWGSGSTVIAFAAAILAGIVVGLFHSLLINGLNIPPFIATLATMAGLRSVAKLLSDNRKISVTDESFRYVGNHLPPSFLAFALMAVLVWLIMSRTVLGRHLYALGGNESAARLSGLPVAKLKTFAYCLSGALAALTGVLLAGKVGQGDHTAGMSYELYAITAAVVGGCSLRGGYGTIGGTLLGLFLIQIIIKGTGVLVTRVDASQIEGLVLGTVIVVAVAFNQILRGRSRT